MESNRIESLYLGKVQIHHTNNGKFLICSNLRGKELKTILTILENKRSISHVTIRFCDFVDIHGNILVQSLSRLRYLEICSINTTATELTALFRALQGSKDLAEIVVSQTKLTYVPPEDLALVLTQVEQVTLEWPNLTLEQCIQIFTTGKLKHYQMISEILPIYNYFQFWMGKKFP